MSESVAASRYWFDGIVEGPRGEHDRKIQALVGAINRSGLVVLHLDMETGRFSLLADDEVRSGSGPEDPRAEAFVRDLGQVIKLASEHGGEIESTLRCTMLQGSTVMETLFAIRQGQLQTVTRERPATADDLEHGRPPQSAEAMTLPVGGKALAVVALLLVLVGGLMAWQSGMIERAFAVQAEELKVDNGDFKSLLSVSMRSEWGRYEVVVVRGSSYPGTPEQVSALLQGASTTAERAAINLVADGGSVWLRLEDAEGKVLSRSVVSLRTLLTNAEGEVKAELSGHRNGHRLLLALDEGASAR